MSGSIRYRPQSLGTIFPSNRSKAFAAWWLPCQTTRTKQNEALNSLALCVLIARGSLHRTNVSAAIVLQDWKRTYGLNVYIRNIPEVEIAIAGHLSNLYNCIHQSAVSLTLNGDGTPGPDFASISGLSGAGQSQVVMGAKKWLLACLQHSDLQFDDNLLGELKIFLEPPQPHVLPDKVCNYHDQLQARLAGGSGLWPDLTQALKALTPAADIAWTQTHEDDIVSTILIFLRLMHSVNYADTKDWLRSSKVYFVACEHVHIDLIETPFSAISLQARHVLADMNFLGNWNFCQHFVRKQYSRESVNCGMFLLYRWLMLAATHPDADPSGKVKAVLARHFDVECLERLPFIHARNTGRIGPEVGRYASVCPLAVVDGDGHEQVEQEEIEAEAQHVVAARLPSRPNSNPQCIVYFRLKRKTMLR